MIGSFLFALLLTCRFRLSEFFFNMSASELATLGKGSAPANHGFYLSSPQNAFVHLNVPISPKLLRNSHLCKYFLCTCVRFYMCVILYVWEYVPRADGLYWTNVHDKSLYNLYPWVGMKYDNLISEYRKVQGFAFREEFRKKPGFLII